MFWRVALLALWSNRSTRRKWHFRFSIGFRLIWANCHRHCNRSGSIQPWSIRAANAMILITYLRSIDPLRRPHLTHHDPLHIIAQLAANQSFHIVNKYQYFCTYQQEISSDARYKRMAGIDSEFYRWSETQRVDLHISFCATCPRWNL